MTQKSACYITSVFNWMYTHHSVNSSVNYQQLHAQKSGFKMYFLKQLIMQCRCSFCEEFTTHFFILFCPFTKSNFIKVMDNTLNKIVAQQLLLSKSPHSHCWTHKIWFLLMHKMTSRIYCRYMRLWKKKRQKKDEREREKKSGFGQVVLASSKPPGVCILYWQWISVIAPIR